MWFEGGAREGGGRCEVVVVCAMAGMASLGRRCGEVRNGIWRLERLR